MSLWVDKHRPSTLSKLDYHKEQGEMLKKLVRSNDFPHLLIYGPSGSGKKTRINCLLKELYGAGAERLRLEQHSFLTPSKKKIEISSVSSNHHIEVNPSEVGIYDRVVVQELIKTMAQSQQVETSSQRNFKVVILTEVERLSRDAQHALRRTMERYTSTCRLILCCTSTSKLMAAIRSRCLGVRVAAPTTDQIVGILQNTCRREGLSLPAELAQRIAMRSERNLRRALLMCEACRVQQYPFSADQKVPEPDWEVFLRETARMALSEQSPRRLLEIRTRLYELLVHCIPPDIIMKGLLQELISSCDRSVKCEITRVASQYEHRMQLGSKSIFHLEAFMARFMAVYAQFLEENLGGGMDDDF